MTRDITLLSALEYEKITFDGGSNNLFSEILPVKLFMGRLSNNFHRTLVPILSMDGPNLLFHSSDKNNLHQLIENAYISSWLNGKVMPYYYHTANNKCFHLTGFSSASLKDSMLISQIDNLYSLCKENEKLPDAEKNLYVVMISNLSDMPFLSKIFIDGVGIEHPNILKNPFEQLDFDISTEFLSQDQYKISVKQKLEDMLTNGNKYGVVFVIGESDTEKYIKLKQYPFQTLELDCVEDINIVTRLKEFDKVLAWSCNKPEDIDAFLENESPLYRAIKAYCNIDL